jgi:hypothetical protein
LCQWPISNMQERLRNCAITRFGYEVRTSEQYTGWREFTIVLTVANEVNN